MTKTVLLRGLRPEPLASYLGALGVLRLVATQLEPSVRGRFTPMGFELIGVDEEAVIAFFQDAYRPTPILSPWNNASGFYTSSKGGPAAEALQVLERSRLPRVERLVEVANRVRDLVLAMGLEAAPKEEGKALLLARVRGCLPDDAIEWLDAVAVVTDDDMIMAPLLGSGGNEGVLEYSGLFLRSLAHALVEATGTSRSLLRAALLAEHSSALAAAPGGQFDPGVAGGFNSGPGLEHKNLPTNPWAFILLVEGAACWASALARRGAEGGYRFGVSPFTVRHVAVGHGSACGLDQDPKRARAEIWAPVWTRPLGLPELLAFLREGRAEVRAAAGARQARDSIDFVEAVAGLGVDRGVSRFVRYALIKRRGDSYIALPAGSQHVGARRAADLLRELERPLRTVDAFLRGFQGDGPPARFASARRAIDEAIFEAASRADTESMLRLVRQLGRLNRELARRDPEKKPKLARPLGGLGAEWIGMCWELPEARVAAALASVGCRGRLPVRAYLEPLDPKEPWKVARSRRTLAYAGLDVPDRLASVMERRLLDANRSGESNGPSRGARSRRGLHGSMPVSMSDIIAFLEGRLDEALLEELLFGFLLVDRGEGGSAPESPHHDGPAPPDYSLLKLVFLDPPLERVGGMQAVRAEPALVPLLRAGRVSDAVEIAARRLRASGFVPRTVTDRAANDRIYGRRLAAALLLPVNDASALMKSALHPMEKETAHALAQ